MRMAPSVMGPVRGDGLSRPLAYERKLQPYGARSNEAASSQHPARFSSRQSAFVLELARCSGCDRGTLSGSTARPDYVAAFLPRFRLIDRNAEELTGDDLDWADVVMAGGMLPSLSCAVPAAFRSPSVAGT
jgi:hypothetical protein